MQLTLHREEVNIVSNEKLNQYSNLEVMPLNIAKGDDNGLADRKLSAIHRKLRDDGWNVASAQAAKTIYKLFNDCLITEVTTRHIDALKEHLLKNGRSIATVNRYFSALSKMFKYAYHRPNEYGLKHIPYIPWGKEDNARVRWVEPKEEREIIRVMTRRNKVEYLNFFLFLMDTGLRKGEACKLTTADVKYDEVQKVKYILVLNTKNGSNRNVPLTNRARAIVEPLIEGQEPTTVVFRHNYWTLQNQWEDMREIMGLEEDKEFTLHCLRHTFASRLAQAGKPLHLIGLLMGHKTLAMTKRYSHLAPEHTFNVLDVLNNDRPAEDAGCQHHEISHIG
jgi:integrase